MTLRLLLILTFISSCKSFEYSKNDKIYYKYNSLQEGILVKEYKNHVLIRSNNNWLLYINKDSIINIINE